MKVTAITHTPLVIGKSLLRIETDAGVDGWAEIPGRNNAVFNAYLESAIAPALIGEDPRLIDRHWETFALGRDERFYKLPGWVVGVVDVALWDILGKDTGLPVHTLMGGAKRTTIPLYWSTGSGWRMQPEEMLALVRDGWERGFRAFKIRMDWRGWRQDVDPEKDYQLFKWAREFLAGGEYLGFDANNGYSVSTAIQQGRRFEALGIDHFEEPIPHYDLPGLKQIADALDVAVSAGEQDAFRWWFQNLVLLGNPDILQPDILSAGGPSEVKRIFEMATTLDKTRDAAQPASGHQFDGLPARLRDGAERHPPARILHRVLRPARRPGRSLRRTRAAEERRDATQRQARLRHRTQRSGGSPTDREVARACSGEIGEITRAKAGRTWRTK